MTKSRKGVKNTMAFKLLYTNLAGPQGDFLVDPTETFEAGMVGKLQGTSTGSPTGLPQVVVADNTTANTVVGIIDDNKTTQFVATVIDEVYASGATALAHANIVSGTLHCSVAADANGFNYSNGTFASARSAAGTASYSYYIPGKAGDDTTLASGKCTLWLQPGEYATDVYEVGSTGTANTFTVGARLYISANGKLTDGVGVAGGSLVVGYVTKTPSAGNPFLNFYKV
jgi:hypothetical protein